MACVSNPDALQFTLRKKDHMGCIPLKKLLHSSCPREDLSQVYDKAGFSAVLKSSSSRTFETLPELCTFRKVDPTKLNQDQVGTAYHEKILPSTENLSKETSGEKDLSNGNMMVKNASSYGNPLPEETGSTGKNRLSFSQEIGSIGKIPVPIDISKSMDVTKFLTSSSDAKQNPTILGGDINVSNAKEVLPVESSFGMPSFETDASLLVPENIKILEFHDDDKKRKQAENLMHSMSVSTKKPYDDEATTFRTSNNHLLLNQSSNKPLKQTLPVLEDWARRGLDTVFNRPAKFSAEELGTHLEKDLEYGLNVMKEMTTRIYTLMRAVNKLPDVDPKLIPGFESIRGDFNKNLIKMWNIIDDIKLQVHDDYKNIKLQAHDDYKNIKLSCDNVSGKSTEDTKQRAKPNIFITNAYTVVIEKLPLLRKQLVDIREKVRIICLEMERVL